MRRHACDPLAHGSAKQTLSVKAKEQQFLFFLPYSQTHSQSTQPLSIPHFHASQFSLSLSSTHRKSAKKISAHKNFLYYKTRKCVWNLAREFMRSKTGLEL